MLTGYLIFRSTFRPRILGVLLTISGLVFFLLICIRRWHTDCSFPYIAVASALGEIPLELWLMVMGVNAQRRKVQAGAAVVTGYAELIAVKSDLTILSGLPIRE